MKDPVSIISFPGRLRAILSSGAVLLALICVLTGCETAAPNFQPVGPEVEKPVESEVVTLREGDMLRIEFPGAAHLNTRQQIRPDGKIVLPLVGEVVAAGKTHAELEKDLIKLYAPQIISKEITVTVESSSFSVYVSGAVLRPGKISSDRPVTALEAIMDAGVDYSKANLKEVKIIRNTNGKVENIILNLEKVIKGKVKDNRPFYLKPSDIIFVPERFVWF